MEMVIYECVGRGNIVKYSEIILYISLRSNTFSVEFISLRSRQFFFTLYIVLAGNLGEGISLHLHKMCYIVKLYEEEDTYFRFP